jgi:hypothetical protein
MKKHVGVLELAGLVTTEKVGRVRTCRIGPCRPGGGDGGIARYRQVWTRASKRWTVSSTNSNDRRRPVVARRK